MKHKNKLMFVALVGLLVLLYFQLDFDLSTFMALVQTEVEQNYVAAASLFFLFYLLAAALNLPGTGVLTIGAGVTFGLLPGVFMVSLASALGGTISMLVSRTLLRDWVQRRFSSFAASVNRGIESDGTMYLLTLRLIPVVPFFVINPVFGLTRMPAWKFYVVSQFGMLPATAIYVNLGATVGSIDKFSVWSVFTPDVLLAFSALLVFPLVAKRCIVFVKRCYALRRYKKPRRFDANVIVIGAGAAGLAAAYIASTLRAKVFLIEKHRMGGNCLNTGCVPSKAFIRSANAAHQVRDAARFGVHAAPPKIDFQSVMQRVRNAIAQVEPRDSVERYTQLGTECVAGEAEILSPYEVKVGERVLTTKKIVIAAGARPRIPDIPGLHAVPYRSSEDLWSMGSLPERLLVLGGGPVGCELAQAFRRLGSNVTVIERSAHLAPKADPEVGAFIRDRFFAEGIIVKTETQVTQFEHSHDGFVAQVQTANSETDMVEFDLVLLALGRQANTQQVLLSKVPLTMNENSTLRVDNTMQTSVPGVYACGDIAGHYQHYLHNRLTHTATLQAWYATVNALFGNIKTFKIRYDHLPWVIFCDPEIAHVGFTESYLKEKGIAHDVVRYDLAELDRAIADSEQYGVIKVMTKKNSDKILGATIIAGRAGEMIQLFAYAKKHKRGLKSILPVIHSYPTYAEASKFAAGQWQAERKPKGLLRVIAWCFRVLRK